MNTFSSNCSITHTELWLMVTFSSLAILSGVFAFVVVVARLKLCLKPMYRSVLYQVLLTMIASAMFIACGGIINNTSCMNSKITFNLALFLVYLQLILFYIMLAFLFSHINELFCKMQKTLCCRSINKWFFEHKYSADIIGIFLGIFTTTSFVIVAIKTKDTTFIFTMQFIIWAELNSIVTSFFVFATFILYCRVKKEIKPLFKKLINQLAPFLGYPVMFVVILYFGSKGLNNDSLSIVPSIWCCTSNIILATHVTIILLTRRNATPRKALSEIGDDNLLNHSIADNIRSSTYFSIPVED